MDVETAFSNANLQEEVCIEVPQGVQIDMPNNCFRLNKVLYGLKQSIVPGMKTSTKPYALKATNACKMKIVFLSSILLQA